MADIELLSRAIAHDPCRKRYRTPVGAVTTGVPVSVRLWIDEPLRHLVESATLLVGRASHVDASIAWESRPMWPDEIGFSGAIPPEREPRVLFYLFELELDDGTPAFYVPCADGRSTAGELVLPGRDGQLSDRGWHPADWKLDARPRGDFGLPGIAPGFQVTVYDPAFQTPDWFEGVVMYQVFPDRFARGADGVRKAGLAYHERMGRTVRLHGEWNGPVEWRAPFPLNEQFDSADLTAAMAAYDPVDFFGGTLNGIREKIPYLASLGVEVLYLNPIFEARSNHRYDTADYEHIEPLLGTDDDFKLLAKRAGEYGIHIVLDAVLSHTGVDSRYFNGNSTYIGAGAAQGAHSPFRSWYDFDNPNGTKAPYRCWWGDPTLPEVNEHDRSWQRYILGRAAIGENPEDAKPGELDGILPHWLEEGASGYRLDVADELPDDILQAIRRSVKGTDPDAPIIGEVWEDATNKVSYGNWRTYALGRSLDSVMNYPLRSALIGFGLDNLDAHQLCAFLLTQKSHYPQPLYRCLMNLMSSHDVERQRSILALDGPLKHETRRRQMLLARGISAIQDARAAAMQALLAAILYALPGNPCLYYGDERGMQGGGDPFCRATFPWDITSRTDCGIDLTDWYRQLGALRTGDPLLRTGDLACCAPDADVVVIIRHDGKRGFFAVVNRSDENKSVAFDATYLIGDQASHWIPQPWWSSASNLDDPHNEGGVISLSSPAYSAAYFLC
ncbi:MAG: glycoside hydrolase family 13 protein [Coriobacteriaceae bacterium]|nr:glycoside hydrolase family 13 protein [Coriobacteriaceae bacterium]